MSMRHRSFWKSAGAITVLGVVAIVAIGADDSELYLRIHRSIELFSKVYKEITLHHVDEVRPEDLMRAGIDGMLESVDPYTVFLDEDESDEIDLVTTGRYGGIGVSIGMRDGDVVILSLLDGYSAAKQGLQIGDKIMAVDGTSISGMEPDEIRRLVRGAPGTNVRFTIEREGEQGTLDFVLVREDIPVRNIPYAGILEPGVAYVRIERFSRTAASDLREQLQAMQREKPLRAVLLDLRDNPGGLLDIAVDMVSQFVPESSLVVSTRGRESNSERKYYSVEHPILPDVPLGVLVNGNSASASEIVAGAVQDLDRGVIIGTRTFGKGLVQTVTRLTESASLKITTARYYTPSGRCIQELDYSKRKGNGDATTMPDSLRRKFRTVGGRTVYEAGGVDPDTVVRAADPGPFMVALYRKALIFKYVNHLVASKKLNDQTDVNDTMLEDFRSYLKGAGFDFDEGTEQELQHVEDRARVNRYSAAFRDKLSEIRKMISSEKQTAFERYAPDIRQAIREEMISRVRGEQAGIRSSLDHDPQVIAAAALLSDGASYRKLIGR